MKNVILFLSVVLAGIFSSNASNTATETAHNTNLKHNLGYENPFIFVENNITFSIFPDGEFDFYVNETSYPQANVNISFNGGYNYNNCLQYDDYGAVIQVVNTPVFYDYYGRVAQIGSVRIHYNKRRVIRIGGLHIFYNPYGAYSHCNGYINVYNRAYVYRPFHHYFVRPVTQFCMVGYKPYRQYYAPVRYSYYKPYYNNVRICYATVGATYYFKQNHPQKTIYKNDKRVSRRSYDAHPAKASRRATANTSDKVSSKRGYSNTSKKVAKRSQDTQKKTAKRNYTNTNTYKKRKSVSTPTKRATTSAKKQSYRKNVVNTSPSAKKTYQRSAPVKQAKTARKSSGNQRKAASKTKGRNTRSRT